MLQIDLSTSTRTNFGKGANRRLRAIKQTPGNLYSKGKDNQALQFDTAILLKSLLGIGRKNAIINLIIDSQTTPCPVLVKEIQKNPVTDYPVHVDFMEISLEDKREFTVAIKCVGTPKGVEMGGELEVYKFAVTICGLPLLIPDYIEVNVSDLEQSSAALTFADLPLNEGVTLISDSTTKLAQVI